MQKIEVAQLGDDGNRIDRIGIFIGGMRCGSTAVLDYMRQHPEVLPHAKKDSHFFSSDANWGKGWDWYLDGWRDFDSDIHELAFESATHYTKYPLYPKTAQRMAETTRDLRLVYGVRSPVERVESHLIHNAGKGYLDPHDAKQRNDLLKQAVNVSNYDLQISQYERYFPPEKLYVLVLDQLKTNPISAMKGIFLFFGIDETAPLEVIEPRPRAFKKDIDCIGLTDAERSWAEKELTDATVRFEEKYSVDLTSPR